MKKILATILLILFLFSGIAEFVNASVRVRGHFRPSTGVWVEPHFRSSPDRHQWNNWSNQGNFNPHTGRRGTRRGW